ncbi:MAG: signal peptidase I [Planctomycetota bacterium]
MSRKKNKPTPVLPRKMRDQVEAIAMAICLAIGLKYFLVEAYEIPTPSMQPTMMGSREAGVHDRILVDKAVFLRRDPRRFDVAIFRYPLNRAQNYVKRIVGLPGEHLTIIGGDVWRITAAEDGGPAHYECLRKPDVVQAGLWRRLWDSAEAEQPDRAWLRPIGRWRADGQAVVVEDTSRGAEATFEPHGRDGALLLVNRYEHGYPAAIIDAVRKEAPELSGAPRVVGDLRWRLTLVPDEATTGVELALDLGYVQGTARVDLGRHEARLCLTPGAGGRAVAQLAVDRVPRSRGGDEAREQVGSVELSDVTWRPGAEVEVELVRLDGGITARVGGQSLGTLVPPWKGEPVPVASVALSMTVRGAKALRVERATLDRDLYYTNKLDHPDYQSEVHVPAGHFWMLGDNTQNSADGRAWKRFTVHVDAEGRLVDARAPLPAGGRAISGGLRFHGHKPVIDPDENPVLVAGKNALVVTDLWGEEHAVRVDGQPDPVDAFQRLARFEDDLFVPRDYVIGKAFAAFWPVSPFRIGLIR